MMLLETIIYFYLVDVVIKLNYSNEQTHKLLINWTKYFKTNIESDIQELFSQPHSNYL